MKRILLFLTVLVLSLSILTSCDIISQIIPGPDGGDHTGGTTPDDELPPNNDNQDTDKEPDKEPDEDDGKEDEYLYKDFSPSEKALFTKTVGEVIPFISNNEYYVEEYSIDFDEYREVGVNFCACGNSEEEFGLYRASLSSYSFDGSEEDSDGDLWFYYSSDSDLFIDVCYYVFNGESYIDVYAYLLVPYEGGSDDSGGNGSNGGDGGEDSDFLYTDFTDEEKALFSEVVGKVIPFAPNNEYYLEEYSLDYDDYYEVGINFYTFDNTKEEFEEYKAKFSSFTYDGTEEDEYGDSWYYYSSGDFYIDLSYYSYEGSYVIDVYAYRLYDYDDEGGSGDSGGNGGDGGEDSDFLYADFTDEEKALFTEYFGEVIPFLINNEYYVEKYTYDYDTGEFEQGINFYVCGATEAQFTLYRALFSDYAYDGTEKDEYGDSWYYYTADSGYYVDMCYYQTEDGGYVADVYVYFLFDGLDDGGSGGNGGNGESGGNGGTTTTPDNLVTNAGAGLPDGNNGIYNVDFTDATNVKNVADQGYYLDGCPTTGSPNVLVIPVDFSDIMGQNKGYSIENIIRAFNGGEGETDYYSVHDYYYISSYGKLDLNFTVIDEWFVPENTSSYYANATYDYYGDRVAIGDQLVMDEALAYLSGFMDLSQFDSDGNSIIDAVVLITTLEIDDTSDFNWAYRYWNIYTDDEGYYYEYDGVSANDYLWASYSFMHESYDDAGNSDYTDTSVMNTYTYIHEFGHILGADDYYDYSDRGNHPLDGCDIMDSMNGDHNPFTKFNLGWITSSRLVVASDSVTLTLESFTKSGDTVIIANNFDPTLGAYQEYYIVAYYTAEGLNDGAGGYFARDGIVVYHVNASLYSEDYEGEVYYDIYNNNTDPSDESGTSDNLIEFVKSATDTFTYVVGDSLPSVTDNQGSSLAYSFTVDSIDGGVATLTFTKG